MEVSAGLLAAVDEQTNPDGGGPAVDRAAVGTDGRVGIASGPPDGGSRGTTQAATALLAEIARNVPRHPVSSELLDELDRTVVEMGAGVPAARQRVEKSCTAMDRCAVRAELGALVRALAESTAPAVPGGEAQAERVIDGRSGAPPLTGPTSSVRRRAWAWLLSIAVLIAVVLVEVVLLRDEITADVHLLLDAGRSGSTASTAPELDDLPVAPPAPPAVGAVASVDLRPLADCTPGAPCTVRVVVRLLPGAEPRTASWSFRPTDRCTGATETASGGSVTVPVGVQQVTAVSSVPLPAYRAVAVVAVTELPAAAAAPPVLLGSCTADRPTG
jgi:hypothetical protein